MSTLVYMKLLERTPARYDRGMRLITLGRIDRLKALIAASWIQPGQSVLEVGCGTGSLAAQMAERGASVLGIDVAEPMLDEAQRTAPAAEFRHLSAVEVGKLGEDRFDRVVATLSLSELSEDELAVTLRGVARVLRPGGLLVIADEVEPAGRPARLLARAARLPIAALTFALTQSTTRALRGLRPALEAAGLQVRERQPHLGGTLALVVAEKPEDAQNPPAHKNDPDS